MNSTDSSFPYRYTHTLMTVQEPPYNFERRRLWVKTCIDRFNQEVEVGKIKTFQLTSKSIEVTYAVKRQLSRPGCALSRFSKILLEANVPGIKQKIENKRLLHSISLDVSQPNCDDTAEDVDFDDLILS